MACKLFWFCQGVYLFNIVVWVYFIIQLITGPYSTRMARLRRIRVKSTNTSHLLTQQRQNNIIMIAIFALAAQLKRAIAAVKVLIKSAISYVSSKRTQIIVLQGRHDHDDTKKFEGINIHTIDGLRTLFQDWNDLSERYMCSAL